MQKLQEIISYFFGSSSKITALTLVGAIFLFLVGETCGLPWANAVRPYSAVLFTFVENYGIIQLVHKLELKR